MVAIDLSVAVLSSDGYRDVWPIFFEYWYKNSPYKELPAYLITATGSFADARVKVINTPAHRDRSWSERVEAGLSQLQHRYILIMTEDLICFKETPNAAAAQALEFLSQHTTNCLRLMPKPPPNNTFTREVGSIAPWALHRVSLQAAIWRRDAFLDLLREGEKPWQFELRGSRRSAHMPGFYSFKRPALHYSEIVGRGKVTRRARRQLQRDGMAADVQRQFLSRREQLSRDLATWRGALFHRFPSSLQHALISRNIVGSPIEKGEKVTG